MTVAERTQEMTTEVREALKAYPGKWVALTTEPFAILAVVDTPSEAFAAAQRVGVEVPLLYRVPDEKSGAYYF